MKIYLRTLVKNTVNCQHSQLLLNCQHSQLMVHSQHSQLLLNSQHCQHRIAIWYYTSTNDTDARNANGRTGTYTNMNEIDL